MFECGLGCTGWCGRACRWDPSRGNGLLFWPDGREKTLKERGLGWDDPPVRVAAVRRRPGRDLRAVVGVTETVTETHVTETATVTKTPGEVSVTLKGGRPKKEGSLTAAERKRRQRERNKSALPSANKQGG